MNAANVDLGNLMRQRRSRKPDAALSAQMQLRRGSDAAQMWLRCGSDAALPAQMRLRCGSDAQTALSYRQRCGSEAHAALALPRPLCCLFTWCLCRDVKYSFNKYWACWHDWLSAFRCVGSHPEAARVEKGIRQPCGAPARLRRRDWGVHALASDLQATKGQYFRVTDELEREASGWFFCFGPGN